MTQPTQPLLIDEDGKTLRFKKNDIVRYLVDRIGLDKINIIDFHDDDWIQLYQLLGYSLTGFGELPIVSDELYNKIEKNKDYLMQGRLPASVYITEISAEGMAAHQVTAGGPGGTGDPGNTFVTEEAAALERGKDIALEEDMPLKLGEVKMAIAMDDFQRMRDAVRNALNPEVIYHPTNTEQMRKDAEVLTFNHLTALQALLNKYEYMEHEGFAGPEVVDQQKHNRAVSSSLVLNVVSNFSGFDVDSSKGFLLSYGIVGSELKELSQIIEKVFNIESIPKEDYYKWETVNDVIEYIWNSSDIS